MLAESLARTEVFQPFHSGKAERPTISISGERFNREGQLDNRREESHAAFHLVSYFGDPPFC